MSVLDEPSAGVDSAARRKLWRVINRSLEKGRTVLLTTHHMGEAAHLGHRIGIMVKGQLNCVGSAQHLKSLYGSGYDVAVRLKSDALERVRARCVAGPDDFEALEKKAAELELVPLIRRVCGDETLAPTELREDFVKFSIGQPGKDFPMVGLFEELERAKEGIDVLEYYVSQASLQQVFLTFAKRAYDASGPIKYDADGNVEKRSPKEWLHGVGGALALPAKPYKHQIPCLFGAHGGFSAELAAREWFAQIPPKLESKGVTPAQWAEWMERLRVLQAGSSAACAPMRCVQGLCCVGTWGVGLMWFGCCPWSSCDPFQTGLRQWLEEFNAAVLEPKGAFAKFLTFAACGAEGELKNDKALSVLVIALSKSEVERLKLEPVLQQGNFDDKTDNFSLWGCPMHAGRVV